MIEKEAAAHNLALFQLQNEKEPNHQLLYAKYVELYEEFLEIGKNYEREHSRGTQIGKF